MNKGRLLAIDSTISISIGSAQIWVDSINNYFFLIRTLKTPLPTIFSLN